MILYFLNRCKIAVHERKFWFLYAVFGIIIYFLYLFIFPSTYIMSTSLNFNIDDSDRLISIPGRSVWRQINRLVGSEQSFLATQVNNMPADIQEKVMKKYIDEVQKSMTAADRGDAIIRQRPQTLVMRYISLNADMTARKYVFTYKGNDYSLGIDLMNYYSSSLVNHIFNSVYNQVESIRGGAGPAPGQGREEMKSGITKTGNAPAADKVRLNGDEIKIYKFLLERISTFKNSEPTISSGNDYSAAGLAINVIFSVVISVFIVLILIISVEFSGKYLTSEMQAARYLNTHIIGSLREIKSISGGKK